MALYCGWEIEPENRAHRKPKMARLSELKSCEQLPSKSSQKTLAEKACETSLIALGACLFGLSALGSLKNPVTRPNKGHGYATVVVSLVDGSFVASEQGEGTHTGKYVTHVVGVLDLNTGLAVWGEGYLTAANGDQLLVKMTPAGPDSFIITGGTGRFEGATGSGTEVMSDLEVMVDPVAVTIVAL